MNIGIVGTGNMGRVLGSLWAELGHTVFFGARDKGKANAALDLCRRNGAGDRVYAGTNDEAAQFGSLIYFNPRDVAPGDVLARPEALDGKIVVESHNGPMPSAFHSTLPVRSRSQALQDALPRARIVKAFNTMAQEVFEHCPETIRADAVSVYIASNDNSAKAVVVELVRKMGMMPVDCGSLDSTPLLEALGDFIRSIIVTRGDVMATLSVHSLNPVDAPRFGPRSATRLT
jgi:8-hydroxy-5-deazaflavin:NADPH oxidoreductase